MQGVVVARFPLFPALLTWIEPKILTTLKGSVFVGVLVSYRVTHDKGAPSLWAAVEVKHF